MAGDMHCHTKFSDGSTSVQDVIKIAKQSGLNTLAITDHDTFEGAFKALTLGKELGVNVITGIEVSAFDFKRERKVHILGYLPDNPERLDDILKKTHYNRYIAGQKMIEKVTKEFSIPADLVMQFANESSNIFKQHIMQALMIAGYTERIFGELYSYLFNDKKGIAYENVEYPDVLTVVERLHAAGAVAVLAHPSVYNSIELFEELIEKGIDGVEINHPRNKPEDIEKLTQIAAENNIPILGGTDFHGYYTKISHPLGTCTTDDKNLMALFKRKRKISDKII